MPTGPAYLKVVAALRGYGLAILAFIIVVSLSVSSYRSTVSQEESDTRTRFRLVAEEQLARLRERSEDLLIQADLIQRHPGFSGHDAAARFTHFVAPILKRSPEIRSLGVLRIDATGQATIEQVAGRDPLHSPRLEPSDILAQAMNDAMHTRSSVATPPLAAGDGRAGRVVIFTPVMQQDAGVVRELVFLDIDLAALLDAALGPAVQRDILYSMDIELLDVSAEAVPLYVTPGFRVGELSYPEVFEVGARRWLAILTARANHYSLMPSRDAGGQLFSSLALGILMTIIVYGLQSRAATINGQVADKTQALAEANDALGRSLDALGETNRLLESEVGKHARAESLLRETTSLQRAILDHAEYAIIYTDSSAIIRVFNPAAERLFGHRAEDLIGHETPAILYPPEDLTAIDDPASGGFAALAAKAPAGGIEAQEITLRRRDGSSFPVNIAVSMVRDAAQNLRGYLAIVADITQRRAAESRIRHLAHYDNLTSLPNRSLLNEHLSEAVRRAASQQRGLAVLFADLDRFKYINDSLGHQAGDQLLLAVAQRLRACLRDGDLVARSGGDEFVIVLDELDQSSYSEDVAARMLAALARPFELCGQAVTITPSIGIALYPHDGVDGETLIKHADAAMYLAKDRGRNNFQFFDHGLSARYSERLDLENRLRSALDENQIFLHYQPQLDTLSGELIGMEALIRWQQADGSLIPPDKFIPIAEECGLIVPLGAWVLNEACRQNQAWFKEGISRVPVSVNLSARQFDDRELLATIESALTRSGLAPAYLDLELTESLVMRNPEHTRNLLAECKKLGLQLSVDDFGTGYSSLSNLKRFPIDRLKIDRSFIRDIVTEADDAAIAQTIIAMAHTLRLEVVAEGVETEAQLALLRRWRCDAYQGYLGSRPISALKMTQLLRTLRATRMVSLVDV